MPLSFARSLWRRLIQPHRLQASRPAARRGGRSVLLRLECLEDRLVPASIGPEEQLFVYLLNLARHDPVAYQQEQNLPVSLAGVAPQAPLAVNDLLFTSSEFHAVDMATRLYFAHTTPEGLTPNQMVRNQGNGAVNSGYPLNAGLPTVANNVEGIAFGGGFPTDTATNTALKALNQLIIDDGVNPPGHRIQLLAMDAFNQQMREVGIGHAGTGGPVFDPNFGQSLDEDYWVVHTAFVSTADKFLTGVVFNDANSNSRYDLGEGIAGVTIDVGGQTATTNAQGGWSLKVTGTGSMTVTATGGGVNSSANVTVGTDNVEVDFIAGNAAGIINFGGGITSPNHAPELNSAAKPVLPAILEDTASPAGTLLSALVNSAITDADAGDPKGIALIGVTGAGSWQFSTDGVAFTNVGAVSPSTALLLSDADQIRFVPNPLTNGTATFTFRAWDQTTGADGSFVNLSATSSRGGSTAFSTATATGSITITHVNHAPVLDNSSSPTIAAIKEDTANPPSVTVASLLGTSVSDVDVGALKGIAVTAATGTGTWQFSMNGGTTFVSFGALANTSALLLRSTDRVRFVPAANTSGVATFTFCAWDQTLGTKGTKVDLTVTGTGGSTAFSLNTNTASVTITPVKDAPLLTPGTSALSPVWVNDPNPAGDAVSTVAGAFITDVDPGAQTGIAVIGLTLTTKGKWQFSTDNGANFTDFGAVSASKARLLDAGDLIRFVPNLNFTMTKANSALPTLTYRAWDQTNGLEGQTIAIMATGGATAFSTATRKAAVRVNDAPVLTPASPARTGGKSTKFNITVAQLLGTSVQDFGTGTVQGIAVTGLTTGGAGTWQFSTDGGVTFRNLVSATDATAVLLRATDRLRFVPNGTATAPTLTFRAWDQTSGAAGKTVDLTVANALGQQSAFSAATDTLTLTLS